MSTVIKVENVSKLYRLGEVGTGSLAHDVNRWWHRMRGNEDPYLKIGQVNDRTKPVGRGGLAAPTLPPEGEMPSGVQICGSRKTSTSRSNRARSSGLSVVMEPGRAHS